MSGKDRSAVAMAGKASKAFWYSTNNGDFVTSTYYYDAYPKWVVQWNDQRPAAGYTGKSWSCSWIAPWRICWALSIKPFKLLFPK